MLLYTGWFHITQFQLKLEGKILTFISINFHVCKPNIS